MSDTYRHSRSKMHKSRGDVKRSSIKIKSHKDNSALEPTTPPHPPRRASIEDLLKKREALQQELENMIENDFPRKQQKHSRTSHIKNNTQVQKRPNPDESTINVEKYNSAKKHKTKDLSPEYAEDTAIDSEDEEALIEKSRQRRKQLIESLYNTQEFQRKASDDINTIYKNENDRFDEHESDKTESSTKLPTDMFAETDDFTKIGTEKVTQDNADESNTQLNDNWDDAEGYYNVRIGDEINNQRYTIKSILGQGMFSNVISAQDKINGKDFAIKIIRNVEITLKMGTKEIAILKEIQRADCESNNHCIKLIRHFTHKNHLCMVLELLHMDLRNIIKKYGQHHGLNMSAVFSYSRQLLTALRFLRKLGILHADIKPDNILVNEKKNILKLCDFGSASEADECVSTAYLVSRFYRAPEIIMGVPYKYGIDIWSSACTIYEMATGRIMFPGSSNNKMLKCFMDLKGKFSTKFIRKGKFKDQHFNYKNNFLLHQKDVHTDRVKYVELSNITIYRDILRELKKYSKTATQTDESKIMQLKDLLEKMLIVDPHHRYSVTDCLKHPFIREEFKKK